MNILRLSFYSVLLVMISGCVTTQPIPVSSTQSSIMVGDRLIQYKYEPIGNHGGAEISRIVTGFKIRNPDRAVVTATIRQAPGQTADAPDQFVVKVTNVTQDAVHIKIRRIDSGSGWAMPIGVSVSVME